MTNINKLSFWAPLIHKCDEPKPNTVNGNKIPVRQSIKHNIKIRFYFDSVYKKNITINIHVKRKFIVNLHTSINFFKYFDINSDTCLPEGYIKLFPYEDAFVITKDNLEKYELKFMKNMTREKFEDELFKLFLVM